MPIGVLGFLVVLWWLARSGERMIRNAGSTGSGAADALGNFIDVFHPQQARADRQLKEHFNAGPVTRDPDDDDDHPIVLIRNPDGTPRGVRVRRTG